MLSQLNKEKAGKILEELDVGERLQITMEMANLKSIGESEYLALSERLVEKLFHQPKINHFIVDGSRNLADAINMMAPGEQHMTLKKIKSQDPKLFMKIGENNLFFDDMPELMGDIYISISQAERQKEEDLLSELKLLTVHGILHLAGYDDKTTRQKKIMREKERHYLKQ